MQQFSEKISKFSHFIYYFKTATRETIFFIIAFSAFFILQNKWEEKAMKKIFCNLSFVRMFPLH